MQKESKAERIKRMQIPAVDVPQELAGRVPPGQVVTDRFPILHEGEVPKYDMAEWSLRVFGEVTEEKSFSYEELLALPQTQIVCDIHCVTRWSKLDNGKPLTHKHGWPFRLVVPHLYFWKSAKWIRGLEFMKEDREGFWERNGFHNVADPFEEQRFSGEDIPIPEDEWVRKEFD